MNSRSLLLFLLIAGFIAIWSDDQQQTELYLASIRQESTEPVFTLNCFPEYKNFTKKIQESELWATELVNFDLSEIQSIDRTIKEYFPSALKTASLCPMEESIAKFQKEVPTVQEANPENEFSQIHHRYLKKASQIIDWLKTESDAVEKQKNEQLIRNSEEPLLDRIADDVIRSAVESFQQIQIMAETYRQTMNRVQRSSKIAVEPKQDTRLQ